MYYHNAISFIILINAFLKIMILYWEGHIHHLSTGKLKNANFPVFVQLKQRFENMNTWLKLDRNS